MKKTVYLLLVILTGFLASAQRVDGQVAGAGSINSTPTSITIPRGVQSARSITYAATGFLGCSIASSTEGQFVSGATFLGTINTSMTIPLSASGSGIGSETIFIPVRVLKMAEQLNVNQFIYSRTFRVFCATPLSVTVNIQVNVTGEAMAEFSITRLQLYFENNRAEITVKRNQPGLNAFADIRFTGSGLFRGYWEVDGRILSYVNRHLVYGRSVTLESPEIPALPTFVTGTHIVKFIITHPVHSVPPPVAVYFVTAEEFREKLAIRLISPGDKSEVDYIPITFKWEGKDREAIYLVEFLEEGIEKPVFSAFTREFEYSLPPPVLQGIFSPGKSYLWRVKGFDADHNISGESTTFKFTFKQLASYVPGQILLAGEGSARGMELIGRIGQKYNLGLIETYDIKSLQMKMALFQTREDIFRLIGLLLKEEGVILAQPNTIFRTMAEPMSDLQNVNRILNLQKLHRYAKGKGVVVAVIDTGVDTLHRDLKERISSSENLLKDFPYKAEIHGTAVAGIIGASLNGFGIGGVAPESEILALRACRQVSETYPEGECYSSSIAKALDVALEYKAKVVNMSFGSVSTDRLLLRLIEEGARKGILFVAPVGNKVQQKDLTFPASHPHVVAVAGMDDRGSPYPNPEIASKARVSAPATNVLTTVPGDKYNFLTGTSLSSATVAGLLTLASGKEGGLERERIPLFKGDLCRWEEELLKLSLCEK